MRLLLRLGTPTRARLKGDDPRRIEATFVEGRMQGQGVVTWADGLQAAGDLNEVGNLEGYGEVKCPGGSVETGFWGDDVQLVKGVRANRDGVVKGTWDSDSRLHGYGQQEVDGKVQQGLFEHGAATWVAAA